VRGKGLVELRRLALDDALGVLFLGERYAVPSSQHQVRGDQGPAAVPRDATAAEVQSQPYDSGCILVEGAADDGLSRLTQAQAFCSRRCITTPRDANEREQR
jgi:hypothetical protein